MQKIIVTGANGFIGSHLVRVFSKRGKNIIALVDSRFDYSSILGLPNVSIVEFSMSNIKDLYDIDMLTEADVLYHLAWSGVNANYRNDTDEQLQNIAYCISILKLAEVHHIKRVLIPGSASEVSCGNGIITGGEVPAPSDIYSATKVATRYLCQVFARQHGITLIWPLITSIYGPGRDDNNLISYTIKSILKGEKPLFTKLEQRWDYLYIDDLINALLLLGEKGKDGIYPIGSGENRQMREYVEIIRNLINPEAVLGIGALPYKNPNKIDNQVMDISKLVLDTTFTPKYDFNTGILLTIDYFKSIYLSLEDNHD